MIEGSGGLKKLTHVSKFGNEWCFYIVFSACMVIVIHIHTRQFFTCVYMFTMYITGCSRICTYTAIIVVLFSHTTVQIQIAAITLAGKTEWSKNFPINAVGSSSEISATLAGTSITVNV